MTIEAIMVGAGVFLFIFIELIWIFAINERKERKIEKTFNSSPQKFVYLGEEYVAVEAKCVAVSRSMSAASAEKNLLKGETGITSKSVRELCKKELLMPDVGFDDGEFLRETFSDGYDVSYEYAWNGENYETGRAFRLFYPDDKKRRRRIPQVGDKKVVYVNASNAADVLLAPPLPKGMNMSPFRAHFGIGTFFGILVWAALCGVVTMIAVNDAITGRRPGTAKARFGTIVIIFLDALHIALLFFMIWTKIKGAMGKPIVDTGKDWPVVSIVSAGDVRVLPFESYGAFIYTSIFRLEYDVGGKRISQNVWTDSPVNTEMLSRIVLHVNPENEYDIKIDEVI